MENQTDSSFEFITEENHRLKRELELSNMESAYQKKMLAALIASSDAKVLAQTTILKMKLEESYKDKMKFSNLIDELEEEKEKLLLKHQREIENEKEKASDFNEEVIGCHKHIKELEKQLRMKNRKFEMYLDYMTDKAVKTREMRKKIEELEDELQLVEVERMELKALKEKNEFLKKRNLNLSNLVDCLMVPEGPSVDSGRFEEDVCDDCGIKCDEICFGKLAALLSPMKNRDTPFS